MLDVSVSYNRYKFLGHEFLTWLWFLIEKDRKLLEFFDSKTSGHRSAIDLYDCPNVQISHSFLNLTIENDNIDAFRWTLDYWELWLTKSSNRSKEFKRVMVHAYNCAMRCANIDFMRLLNPKITRATDYWSNPYDSPFNSSQNPQVLLAHLELGRVPRDYLELVVGVDFSKTFRAFANDSRGTEMLLRRMIVAGNVDFLRAYIQEDHASTEPLVALIVKHRNSCFADGNFRMIHFSLMYVYANHCDNDAHRMTKFLDDLDVDICRRVVSYIGCTVDLKINDPCELLQIIDFPGVTCSHYPTLFNATLEDPACYPPLFPCVLRHCIDNWGTTKIVGKLQRELDRAAPSSDFIDAFRASTLSDANFVTLFSNAVECVDASNFLIAMFQCTFDTYALTRSCDGITCNLAVRLLNTVLQSSDYEIPEHYFHFIVRDLVLAHQVKDIDVLLTRYATDQPTKHAFVCATVALPDAEIRDQLYDYHLNKKRKI